MSTNRHTPGPLELLWRALNSLPVAIFVMLALALLSALGTLIPQSHLTPQPPGMDYADFAIARYGEQKYKLLHALGFDHIYFTWYFNALLTWLAVSAVICNIVRWRTTWRLWTRPVIRRGARFFAADRRSWHFLGSTGDPARGNSIESVQRSTALDATSPGAVVGALADDLRLLGYRVRQETDSPAITLYADRGFAKKWALVLLHVAILILLAGGFYGAAVGVKGDIRLKDGEQQTLTIDVAEGKYDWVQPWLKLLPKPSWDLHQHGFRIDWGKKIVLETGVLENVPTDLQEYYWYYVDDYVSDLEVRHQGRTTRREVKVNHPLVNNKLVLYQSGYDQRGYLTITTPGGTRELRIPDPIYGTETLYALTPDNIAVFNPNTQGWVIAQEREEDYALMPVDPLQVSGFAFRVAENVKSGDLYHHNKKVGRVGPLAIFTLRDNRGGMELGSILITAQQGFDTLVAGVPYSVHLSDKVDDYSVFSFKRDPGSPVLFMGWLLLVIGIALTMYVPFTQLWVRAESGSLSVLALGPDRRRLRRRLDALLGVEDEAQSPG